MFAVGSDWSQRREYRTVRESVDTYQAVSASDIASLLGKYPLSQPTTVAVGALRQLQPPARPSRG
jgi:hypothetical protein